MAAPERRKKAQENFETANLVFDARTTFEAAFPDADTCLVTVEETGQGVHAWERGHPRAHRNPGEYIDCSNPLCNGGFQIGSILRDMVQKHETTREGLAFCLGHDTSPKGRRVHGMCRNSFRYEVTVTYKSKPT